MTSKRRKKILSMRLFLSWTGVTESRFGVENLGVAASAGSDSVITGGGATLFYFGYQRRRHAGPTISF